MLDISVAAKLPSLTTARLNTMQVHHNMRQLNCYPSFKRNHLQHILSVTGPLLSYLSMRWILYGSCEFRHLYFNKRCFFFVWVHHHITTWFQIIGIEIFGPWPTCQTLLSIVTVVIFHFFSHKNTRHSASNV